MVLIALLSAIGDPAREWLRLSPNGVAAGEWWRLVTAHLVHLGHTHAAMNAIGLVLVLALFAGSVSARLWLLSALCSAVAVSFGLLWLNPGLGWYVGLSGVLHGLFVTGALALVGREPRLAIGMLVGVVLKLAYEQSVGPVPGSEASVGGVVLVDAHLYGAIGGLAVAVVGRLRARAGLRV